MRLFPRYECLNLTHAVVGGYGGVDYVRPFVVVFKLAGAKRGVPLEFALQSSGPNNWWTMLREEHEDSWIYSDPFDPGGFG